MKSTGWKRWLVAAGLLTAAVTLTACGQSSEKTDSSSKGNDSANIKLWVDSQYVKSYQKVVDEFEKEHPNWKVTIKPSESASAQENLKKDPSSAADVFMMPHDQLGQMVEAGIVYPNTKYAATVKKANGENAVAGATYKGKVYGYPYGVETQVLYYNKSKLSTSDVSSWETMTSKAKIGANFGEAGANYIFTPLFMSVGDELYGAKGEELKGTNFDNAKGEAVLKWVAEQKANSGVVQSNADALSNLGNGKIDAFLSGPWSKNDAKKALGDNYAVAPYPKVTIGGETVQQQAFLGVKLFAVNASTKSPLASMALANYLATEKVQLKLFKEQGIIPSNTAAQATTTVKEDPLAKAVMQMSETGNSTITPKLPEMSSFWGPIDALLNDVYNGKVKASDYAAKLKSLVETTSKSGN